MMFMHVFYQHVAPPTITLIHFKCLKQHPNGAVNVGAQNGKKV